MPPRGRNTSRRRRTSVSLFFLLSFITAANAYAAMHAGNNRWGPSLSFSSRANSRNASTRSSALSLSGDEDTSSTSNNEGEVKIGEAPPQLKTIDILSLDSIRSSLIRQEETIIFALIERAQFLNNQVVYERGAFGDLQHPGTSDTGEPISFLEYLMIGTEALHCLVRRYTSPEEHPFFPEQLEGKNVILPALDFPPNLLSPVGGACDVNLNPVLLKRYITEIVPSVTKRGDDEQHGSTVLSDIIALQALSRRVHYGKFVAESKYRDNPEEYQRLVDADDAVGVWNLLTNMEVEKKVLRRSRLKAATYGRDPLLSHMPEIQGDDDDNDATSIVAAAAAAAVVAAVEAMGEKDKSKKMGKIDPSVIESIYRDVIIPLTKDVEVAYLFLRCGREPPENLSPDSMSHLVQHS